MKLRIKFFLISSLIAIIPSVALTFIAYQQYVNAIDDHISSIVAEQFQNLVQSVNGTYATIQRAFHMMTYYEESSTSVVNSLKRLNNQNLELTPYEKYQEYNNIHHFCSTVNSSFDGIFSCYVFDASGSLVTFQNTDYISHYTSYNCIAETWYQNILDANGEIYICTRDTDILSDTPHNLILFAKSVTNYKTHQPIGIIVFEFSSEIFHLDYSNALGTSGIITLSNRKNGETIYSSIDSEEDSIFLLNSANTILTQEIPDTGLNLCLMYDHSSLLHNYNKVAISFLIFALLCIIFVLILSYIFSHSLVHPIEILSDQMLHTDTSHLEPMYSEQTTRPDEIGILYRQYYSLLDTLNTYIKDQYQNKLMVLDAQMKSLEARINSHFLFNTLEAINSMAELNENEEIATMSLALGRMFRYAIKTESELVTLEQELTHVTDYIAIQSIRFNNRFQFLLHIPQELYDKRMLKLILQPIVENALAHGLNYCTYGNEIAITGCITNNNIQITISDNGQGISEEELVQLRSSLNAETSFTNPSPENNQSIGLKNIQSRIELYYGKGYGLTIFSSLNHGTSIQITIPNL